MKQDISNNLFLKRTLDELSKENSELRNIITNVKEICEKSGNKNLDIEKILQAVKTVK